jgi:hypothetical protein
MLIATYKEIVDKTNFDPQNNPGYLYTPNCIRLRITFIRDHGHPATHQSSDNKIRRTDEGATRSLFEMVYPTATHNDIEVNYNYATFHMYFSYVLYTYSSLNLGLPNK